MWLGGLGLTGLSQACVQAAGTARRVAMCCQGAPPAPPTPSSGSFLNNFRQQLLCSAHCLSLFRPPQSGSLSATDAIPRGSEAGSLGSGCPRSQPLLGHRLLVMSPMVEGQR